MRERGGMTCRFYFPSHPLGVVIGLRAPAAFSVTLDSQARVADLCTVISENLPPSLQVAYIVLYQSRFFAREHVVSSGCSMYLTLGNERTPM